jgi:uroporphyrinogen decarboxylase
VPEEIFMNQREELLALLDSGPTALWARNPPHTYVPAAFFLHFDPARHLGPAAVERHREFFRFTGMDFVKVQYECPFPRQTMARPADRAHFPLLGKSFFEPQLAVVHGLVEALKTAAPRSAAGR